MSLAYQQAGLSRSAGSSQSALVRALQRDLRALGYLRAGIDGSFGAGTAQAVRALTYDLLHNDGRDGRAPVAIRDYNHNRLQAVTDTVTPQVADCIESLLTDPAVPQLPCSDDSAGDNRRVVDAILALASVKAPSPFIVAMIRRESGAMHFRVPAGSDADNFVVVGLDRNDQNQPDSITSRGYGVGQYTLFHHPPQPSEVRDFIVDPVRNIQSAFAELRDKFNGNVIGQNGADDRAREHPLLDLRLCKYPPADRRFMRDCQACAAKARKIDITAGMPPYAGAPFAYQPDQYYPSATYDGVPDRADFLCDWPYAARRYNGGGNDSFHYQTRILLNLLAEPPVTWS